MDLELFLIENKKTKNKNLCKMNSLLFHEEFIELIKQNVNHKITENLAQEIFNNLNNSKLVRIKFDSQKFNSNKNNTFKWGNLIGILDSKNKKEINEYFYSQFFIRGIPLSAQFRLSDNLFTGNLFSFHNKSSCFYPLIKIKN